MSLLPKPTRVLLSAKQIRRALLLVYCSAVACSSFAAAQDAQRPRTFFVTRSLAHPELIPYLKTAKPELVQIGNYGAMFHGYADNKKSTGWPMQLPVVG